MADLRIAGRRPVAEAPWDLRDIARCHEPVQYRATGTHDGISFNSSVGFGLDLLALPVLLIIDLDLPGTLVLLLITSSAQIALAVHQLRNAVHWRELGPVIGAPLVG